MAEQKAKNNKNLIIGICSVAAVAIIAVIIAVFATRGGQGAQLNDDYFVSDDSKYVITMDSDEAGDEGFNAIKTHIVYNYSGDDITDLKYYYEFADAATAKANFSKVQDTLGQLYKNVELNDKYVILTSNKEDFEDMTADDVKQQIEFMKLLEEINLDDTDATEGSTVEEDTTEETTE